MQLKRGESDERGKNANGMFNAASKKVEFVVQMRKERRQAAAKDAQKNRRKE